MKCKPITPLSVLVFTAILATDCFTQSCPKIQNCPTGIVSFCDESSNDQVFWNAPSFTWHAGLQSADLPESSVDLGVTVLDTCPGVLKIKYTLFLDLDSDNLAESVVTSGNQFPGGKILFGNAFNPGYTGTDTIVFDNRAVPDSMKFRFALETEDLGGIVKAYLRWSTATNMTNFLAARLPEGRHHILWTVEKNGVAQHFCEYLFRVKDCLTPLLECLSGWTTNIPASDTLTLKTGDFVLFATDNITPYNLLQFSLRRAGTGSGFPLNALGKPVTSLPFTCADLGFNTLELWVRDLAGNTAFCEAGINLFDFEGNCTQAAEPIVCATAAFVNHDTILHMDYKLETLSEPGLPQINLSVTRLPNGCIELPDFSQYPIVEVAVKPRKNDDPLNGVSTFDLVLINRHIIGLQIFNKTWKYLAADANNSGTLTTLDIIELRKLILGTYDTLPNSTSWKFVISGCSLDSINPFNSACPASLVFQPEYMPEDMNFLGIKTGDVNGNASPDSLLAPPESRESAALLLPDRQLAAGETVDLPIHLSEPAEWIACQWALQWDPDALALEAVLPGSLPGVDESAAAQPRPGVLTFSWFAAEPHWLLPGQALCTFRVRALRSGYLSAFLQAPKNALRSEAYEADGTASSIRFGFTGTTPELTADEVFPPQPNPTAGAASFPFFLTEAGSATLEVYDTEGRIRYFSEQTMAAGNGALTLPSHAAVTPGVYVWRVKVGRMTKTGRLVRL